MSRISLFAVVAVLALCSSGCGFFGYEKVSKSPSLTDADLKKALAEQKEELEAKFQKELKGTPDSGTVSHHSMVNGSHGLSVRNGNYLDLVATDGIDIDDVEIPPTSAGKKPIIVHFHPKGDSN